MHYVNSKTLVWFQVSERKVIVCNLCCEAIVYPFRMEQVLYKGESEDLFSDTTSVSEDSTSEEYDKTDYKSWVTASLMKWQCIIITCNCLV